MDEFKIILSGVQSIDTPYTYIRGCSEKIFSSVQNRPPQVDLLHSEAICLTLPLSQIWSSIQADEHVKVWRNYYQKKKLKMGEDAFD